MFRCMFYLSVCQYLTYCLPTCYRHLSFVDIFMLVLFEVFNSIRGLMLSYSLKYWRHVSTTLIDVYKNYCILNIITERSTSCESQQADLNQDTTSLLLLFSPILQAGYHS